jgi:predicted metalloprotease with PDZ domain
VRDTLRLAIPVWAPGAYRVGAYHRYIDHLTATTEQGSAVPTVRDDSSTWRLAVPAGHDIVVRYDVHYPTAQAAAGLSNYSFFRADGALLSGPMTYLYIVGHKLIPAHVTFDLPAGWTVVTGLVPTASPRMFFAPTYDVLIDCPTLAGATLHVWPFDLDGVHHRVAYYSTTPTVAFDTARFLQMHERVVATARDIMGRLPYREYTFIYEDGPGGGLEHLNSTTITAPGERVKGREEQWAGITAHEYFHAWNVKRVRPVELGPFAYDRPVRTTDLWWAEGMTDYFSTEIRRRSGLTSDTDAVKELAGRIGAYFNTPGYDHISPQRSSWTAWDPNTVNGGYNVSYYLTGSLIGDLLELTIRHATNGARGMDDVERLLFDRYAGNTGYTTENLLNAVNQVCGCDLQPFFDHYIAGHEPLPFDAVLAFAGWSVTSVRKTTDDHGQPLPDVRANIVAQTGVGSPGGYAGSPARLSLNVPDGSFGRAGLVDGDFITSVNGKAITTPIDFKAAFANAKVGDRYTVAYVRAGRPATTSVTILPETRVVVTLSDLPTMTETQRAIREAWLNGPAAHANVYHASATH